MIKKYIKITLDEANWNITGSMKKVYEVGVNGVTLITKSKGRTFNVYYKKFKKNVRYFYSVSSARDI